METLFEGCTPATREHNRSLLLDHHSNVTLPEQFVIRKPDSDLAVLVKSTRLPYNVWKFDLVPNPSTELLGYHCIPADSHPEFSGLHIILVQRVSTNPEYDKKLYKTEVEFQGVVVSGLHHTIPVLKFSNPHTILASRFSRLDTAVGAHWCFPFVLNQPISQVTVQRRRREALEAAENAAAELLLGFAGVQRAAPAAKQSSRPLLPQHIVNIFVEAAVAKQETCPITQEALTKETMVVTPCGHGLDNSSATHWISTKHSCPVCREPCSEAQLQKWSA